MLPGQTLGSAMACDKPPGEWEKGAGFLQCNMKLGQMFLNKTLTKQISGRVKEWHTINWWRFRNSSVIENLLK